MSIWSQSWRRLQPTGHLIPTRRLVLAAMPPLRPPRVPRRPPLTPAPPHLATRYPRLACAAYSTLPSQLHVASKCEEVDLFFVHAQQYLDQGNQAMALAQLAHLPQLNPHLPIHDHAPYLDVYAQLMETHLAAGRVDAAQSVYDQVVASSWQQVAHHNRRIVKAAVVTHFAKGQFDECERLLRNRQIDMTSKTASRIIHTLIGLNRPHRRQGVSGRRIVRAIQSLERILDVQLGLLTILHVMRYLGQRDASCSCVDVRLDDARRLYRWVRGDIGIKRDAARSNLRKTDRAASSILYLTMIQIAQAHNDIALAERVWHERLYRGTCSSAPNAKPFKPASLAAYNLLLDVYASELPTPNLARVQRTYRRLIRAGHQPNIITYNQIIKALVHAEKPDAANHVFDSMLAHDNGHDSNTMVLPTPMPSRALAPDRHTVNLILQGWVNQKNWERVETFLEQLQQLDLTRHLNLVSFNILVRGFLHLDAHDLALEQMFRNKRQWHNVKHLRAQRPYPLTSTAIWDIFESSTGRPRHEWIKSHAASTLAPSSIARHQGFVDLFRLAGTDASTCKLFIKAFTLAKDKHAAHALTQWMHQLDQA
ncbi:hypothetical protein BC940DRAFT_298899 [Gongronella butleri]|nr:hypothetical protein BC940DRAFT_298899 [Gongronella butleri]